MKKNAKKPSQQNQIIIPQQEEIYLINSTKNTKSNYYDYNKKNSQIFKQTKQYKNETQSKISSKLKSTKSLQNFRQNYKNRPQQSIELKQLAENIIVIQQGTRKKVLQYQYQMLHNLPQQICQSTLKNVVHQPSKHRRRKSSQKRLQNQNKLNLFYVQQIKLFTNYLRSFKQLNFSQLSNLRYLDLSQNMIQSIPSQKINQNLSNLQTLKLNSNQIQILPYIKHIRVLEIVNNPIKYVSKKILYTNIQTIQFDWMGYLANGVGGQNNKLEILNMEESEFVGKQEKKGKQKNGQLERQSTLSKFSNLNSKAINAKKPLTAAQILKYEYLKKLSQKQTSSQINKNNQFCRFSQLINLKLLKISHQQQLEQIICQLLNIAIQNEHQFFINYLIKYYPGLHYNKMNLYNQFLLEKVLRMKSFKSFNNLISLFEPKNWPYDNENGFPYVDNLFLGVKYQAVSFVDYLLNKVSSEYVGEIITKNKQRILQFLLMEYRQSIDGQNVAQIVCNKLFEVKISKGILQSAQSEKKQRKKSQKQLQKTQIDLSKFPLHKSKAIIAFWNLIVRNQKFINCIKLTQRRNYFENSLIHFAMRAHEEEILFNILFPKSLTTLQKHQNNVFQRNRLGQTAKSQFGGDKFFRKIFWQEQIKIIDQRYYNLVRLNKKNQFVSNQNKSKLHSKPLINKRQYFTLQYTKLSHIRTKSLRSLLLHNLQHDTLTLRSILSNNNSNSDFIQKQQQMIYSIFKILCQLKTINIELKQKIIKQVKQKYEYEQMLDKFMPKRYFSQYAFNIMLLKLYQTEIYDKRCFMAKEIEKNIGRLNNNPSILNTNQQKIKQKHQKYEINTHHYMNSQTFYKQNFQQNQNKYEISYTNNQLLFQYQLMHSIPILRAEKLFATNSLKSEVKYSENLQCYDVSKLGCRRCD